MQMNGYTTDYAGTQRPICMQAGKAHRVSLGKGWNKSAVLEIATKTVKGPVYHYQDIMPDGWEFLANLSDGMSIILPKHATGARIVTQKGITRINVEIF